MISGVGLYEIVNMMWGKLQISKTDSQVACYSSASFRSSFYFVGRHLTSGALSDLTMKTTPSDYWKQACCELIEPCVTKLDL